MKVFAFLVIATVFLFGVCNFINQMYRAQHKEFWLDEKVGLEGAVKSNTYLGLLAKGAARTEANAAPLDYIFTKIFDDAKKSTAAFGLSDEVYYRLWPNFVMVFSGFAVVCLFAGDILRSASPGMVRAFQLLLLLFLPLFYLYRPQTYHYAAETRPYALWFALWFICIALCSLKRTNKFALVFFLSLMAMTMVGSLFQVLAVAMAYFIVQGQHSGWKQAVADTLQISLLPLGLVAFYSYPGQYGHHSYVSWPDAWHQFYVLWGHEWSTVLLIMVTVILLLLTKQAGPMVMGPLAVLIIFLMGPAIVLITLGRGYFFTERQYIYYDAHRAVFWLTLINGMPFYLEKVKDAKKKLWMMAALLAVLMLYVFSAKTIAHIQTVIHRTLEFFGSG